MSEAPRTRSLGPVVSICARVVHVRTGTCKKGELHALQPSQRVEYTGITERIM